MKKILRGCGNIFLVLIVLGVVSNIFRGGDRNTTSTRPTTIPPTQTPYIIIITATTGINEARPSGLVTTIPTATPGVVALAATDEPTSTAPSSSTPMGLSDVEAAQWSHLDRDKDGVACYGD